MRRREFIVGLCGAAAWPLAVSAQQPARMRRIGVLMGLSESDPEGQERFAAFRERLQTLGWTEGRNVRVITRWAAGSVTGTRDYAAELVSLRPDVILVNTPLGLAALQQATRSIPVVFVQVVDAAEGDVRSTAHPGGNITGFYTFFEYAMTGKWLEILKEAAPRVTRVAALQNPEHPAWSSYLGALRTIAQALGVEVIPAGVHDAAEIDPVIEMFAREPDGALIVLPDTFTTVHRSIIAAAAARHRLPSIGGYKSFATDGGLISYGANLINLLRQSASYVDYILRGEKPGELPVQESTKFELVINLKTAKALGLTIPETLLATADEVIQ